MHPEQVFPVNYVQTEVCVGYIHVLHTFKDCLILNPLWEELTLLEFSYPECGGAAHLEHPGLDFWKGLQAHVSIALWPDLNENDSALKSITESSSSYFS